MKITASIVTFNNITTIKKCITSLMDNTKKYSIDLFIIDNKSQDGTVQYVEDNFPYIKIIRNTENIGFGKAHNQILPFLGDGFHFIINPDIFVREDIIGNIVDYMLENPNIGMVTPRILNPDGTLQHLPKLEPRMRFIIGSKIPYFKNFRKTYTQEKKEFSQPTEIEFCTGCFFCIKNSVFKDLDGFDDSFFMYFEDADISKRVKEKNKVILNPFFSVYHQWNRENAKTLKGIIRYLRSMCLYFNKWGWKI